MTERRLRLAVGALALLGAGLAAYLTYIRYAGGTVACTSGGCELVQGSRYSAVGSVPVALIGLIGYVLIFGSALASPQFRLTEVVLLTVVLIAGSIAIFVWGLGLPYPLFADF